MTKKETVFFIEKEYFEFQLNLGNNYKELAKQNFDRFTEYVNDAKNDGMLSRLQIKKYDNIIEKYTRFYSGDEEALTDKKYESPKKKIILICIAVLFVILATVFCVKVITRYIELTKENEKETVVQTPSKNDDEEDVEYPTKELPTSSNTNGSGIDMTVSDEYIEKVVNTRVVEKLDRGLVAIATDEGVFLSWRYLGTDDKNITFNVYRDGECITSEALADKTNYVDTLGVKTNEYYVEAVLNGVVVDTSNVVSVNENNYFDVPIQKPDDLTMPDQSTCTYSANDASVADLDGDGQYEIVLKWDPSNAHDNSHDGYTGNVYIDAYEMDGTLLWRIDLGVNIRAGAHYTQFMVYDYDCDGLAEVICKTADGTVDGKGTVIGDATADYRTSAGRILEGPEFLTLFDGKTGEALDTVDYEPGRGNVASWGDDYGNRVDRFLAATAYLDGETPSVIMCRGYYTRSVLVAYDVVDNKLVKRWTFDSNEPGNSKYAGQGYHNLAVADTDYDGKDEIVYGQCVIDDDGTGAYSTGFGHGDALHVGDFLPERAGLEVWGCLEGSHGAILYDAYDGDILMRISADSDTGRAICGNFIPGNNGAEFASAADSFVYDANMKVLTTWGNVTGYGMNYAIYWDGDLEQEVLDKTVIEKYEEGRLLTGDGVTSINGTKSNCSLVADILGDWREEVIWPTTTSSALRIYTTTTESEYRIHTLMHDTQYRCQIVSQNVAYNQGACLSYFLGTGYDLPEQPNVKVVE